MLIVTNLYKVDISKENLRMNEYKTYLSVFVLLVALAVPLNGQCSTNFSQAWCGDCPNPSLYGCWESGVVSYSVDGAREETWCNWTSDSGWCSYYNMCTTVSSISTSKDCYGDRHANQASICCMVP